jgi:thiamine transport system permease protein
VAFVAVFFAYPLARIVDLGIRPDGRLSLEGIRSVLGDPSLRGVIAFTAVQALLSTVATLAIGLPAAYATARYRFPGRGLLRAITLVPFVLPTVVIGLAFGGGEGSWAALLAGHAFFNLAVVVRVVGGAWAAVDPGLEDAADELGARGWRRITAVMLPLARPAVAAAATLVALFCFTSFGAALLLAPPGRATIEVEIWRQSTLFLDLPVAAALALIQVVFTGVLLAVERSVGGSDGFGAGAWPAPPRSPRSLGERAFLILTVSAVAVYVVVPLVRVVARSLTSVHGLTVDRYLDLGEARPGGLFQLDPAAAIATSLRTALAATAIALIVGLPASFALGHGRTPIVPWLVTGLPLGVSAVAVGLGYLIAFREPPLDIRASWWTVPLAQAVVALPFVLRLVAPAVGAARRDLAEQAAALGASPRATLRDVILPVAAPAIAGAAAFAFAVSLGEFGATAFLARSDSPTMPVAIVRLLGQPGAASLGQAYAMATILMVVTLAIALLTTGSLTAPAERR